MTCRSSPLRIWGLFRHYYPNFSGASIQGHRILSHLANQGCQVVVLAAADHEAKNNYHQEVLVDGIRIQYLRTPHRRDWNSIARFPFWWKLARYLNALFSSFAFNMSNLIVLWLYGKPGDIVQFYSLNEFSFLVEWVALRKHMHPVVRMTLMGADDPFSSKHDRNKLNLLGKKLSFHLAEKIVSLSSAMTESCRLANVKEDKIVYIPNGVNLKSFSPVTPLGQKNMRKMLGLEPERKYITFVGSALKRKGIDILVESFIIVAKQAMDVDLLIIGPNDFSDYARHKPEREKLVDALKLRLDQENLSHRVHWIGQVTDVCQFLQATDIFFFPSRREGLPTSIIEAMGVGIPIIASKLDGITTDLINSGTEGLLVDSQDPEIYAETLFQLLHNHSLAKSLGDAARRRAESEFDIDVTSEKYFTLYNRLVMRTL